MRSVHRGRSTSAVEVTNVSTNGFWMLLDGDELFVSFKLFPWFRDASIGQLVNVDRPSAQHLRWPDLDVDLAVESLTSPERYPLVSRERAGTAPGQPDPRAKARQGARKAGATRPRA